MPHDPKRNRLKLFGSLIVLAIVLIIATIAQFTGRRRVTPVPQDRGPTQARAVFGDTRAIQPAEARPGTEQRAPVEEASRGREESAPAPASDINGLLNRWRDTVVRGDSNAHAILYAPRMDRFFRRRNVTREMVRREKARMMELYPDVKRYEISDVRVESQRGDEAVVSFRKEWDMRGDRLFSGAERQRLKLRRIAGDWKIVSEEELRVYWLKRG
jgi:hypothetical protein